MPVADVSPDGTIAAPRARTRPVSRGGGGRAGPGARASTLSGLYSFRLSDRPDPGAGDGAGTKNARRDGDNMRSRLQQAGLVFTGLCAGVLISLNFSANADKSPLAPLPVEELRNLADVFNAIKQGYVEPVEDKKLITHAISGMLSNLDPHSAYLDAEAFKELQVGTQGEFGGLGIEVGMEDGLVKVVSPIEDTPAYRAGVKAGDLIFKLDDTPVKGLSLSDAVKKMRGKPKTPVTLQIMRKGVKKPITIKSLSSSTVNLPTGDGSTL